MNEKWTTEFPTKPGIYWFYGYRYGKISCGSPNELELVLITAFKVSNGLAVTGDGTFIYPEELESPHFCKAELPDFPEID